MKRIEALIYANYNLPKDFNDYTYPEIGDLLGEIPVVSTTFNLKEFVGSFMIKDFRRGQDFEEFNSKAEQEEADFRKLQLECIKIGLKPPTSRKKD